MATLRRDDGLQFIVQPYRELFTPDRVSALKRKIRMFAQRQGEHVRVFKAGDRLEVVFSREPGFLLGETVWTYLDKPRNLIYCEALPERRQALIVVVKDGVVFLDARLSFTNVVDEIISLSITDTKYDIYVYGDVPLGETEAGGKFAFDAKNINSFNVLDEPLLNRLPVSEEVQLQPLSLALTSPNLGKPKTVPIIIGAAIFIVILISWHLFSSAAKDDIPQLKLIAHSPLVNPYSDYYKVLESPKPQDQIVEMLILTDAAYNFPGWSLAGIGFNAGSYTMALKLAGTGRGSVAQVQAWADANDVTLQLQSDGVTLTFPSKLQSRKQPKVIYPLDQVLGALIDNIGNILGSKNVQFSNTVKHNHYKEATVTISFSNTFAGMLVLIGQELNALPVTVTAANMTVNDNI
ncbi:MAG: hypothetical protein KAT71_06090, partial [Gammaproteobacteria bacterium]|nr:hypothetical protein [Gammaproteobacteria bacterium]